MKLFLAFGILELFIPRIFLVLVVIDRTARLENLKLTSSYSKNKTVLCNFYQCTQQFFWKTWFVLSRPLFSDQYLWIFMKQTACSFINQILIKILNIFLSQCIMTLKNKPELSWTKFRLRQLDCKYICLDGHWNWNWVLYLFPGQMLPEQVFYWLLASFNAATGTCI